VRNRERGAVLVTALLATVSLMTLSGVALLATRTHARTQANGVAASRALWAAQAGVAAAIEDLRWRCDPATGYTAVLDTSLPPEVGEGNPLAGSYDVRYRNNAWDRSGSTLRDEDGMVLIQSVGRVPTGGAQAMLVVQVQDARCDTQRIDGYDQRGGGPMGEWSTDRGIDATCQETTNYP
jgi:hypothetical protein